MHSEKRIHVRQNRNDAFGQARAGLGHNSRRPSPWRCAQASKYFFQSLSVTFAISLATDRNQFGFMRRMSFQSVGNRVAASEIHVGGFRTDCMPSAIRQNRPMRDRDVDSDEGLCTLRRHEQRLERRKKTTSNRVGPIGLALATHRTRNWCASGDGQRLPEGHRHCRATAKSLGTATAGKTGQRGERRVDGRFVGPKRQPQPQNHTF